MDEAAQRAVEVGADTRVSLVACRRSDTPQQVGAPRPGRARRGLRRLVESDGVADDPRGPHAFGGGQVSGVDHAQGPKMLCCA